MTREEKAQIIDELSQKFAANPYFYITDTSNMTVEQVNKLRRKCFEKGIELQVVKNSLIRKALETTATDYSSFNDSVLTGFSGVMFNAESGKTIAALIKEFRKSENSEKPILKGASIDSALFIGNESLDTLLTLKNKAEMIGEVIGLLQSPAKNVISGLKASGGKIAGILKTLSEKEGNQ